MALQVGDSCYATPFDAGVAACAFFSAPPFQNTTQLVTSQCVGTQAGTGSLIIQTRTTTFATNSTTAVNSTLLQGYPPCVETDYLVAGEVIAGALLSLWAIGYCGYKVLSFLGWSRGDSNV